VTGGEVPEWFWAELVARLLHPSQLQIIEALRWVDRPLSASELVQVLGTGQRLSTIAYHVRRLDSLGVLTPAGKRHPLRGSEEKLYRLGFR
jgi:Helix-turn-helix domain